MTRKEAIRMHLEASASVRQERARYGLVAVIVLGGFAWALSAGAILAAYF